MNKCVAYYRVSTEKQGRSGLGLETQRSVVADFVRSKGIEVLGEFVEVQTGKNDDREQLSKAIALAKKNNCAVVVAKLDRLSRSVSFISGLMASGVKFVSVELGEDVPAFMLHIFAAFGEEERRLISERTKSALQVAKKRGVKLGSKNPIIQKKIIEATKQRGNRTKEALLPMIQEAFDNDVFQIDDVCDYLNTKGFYSPRGNPWRKGTLYKFWVMAKGL
jgi:DNA invertase Pin-like site-specific DNA recombinase